MLATKLQLWFENNSPLTVLQYGFKSGVDTRDQVINFVFKYVNKGEKMYVVFIGLKTAFDSVKHDILWSTIKERTIPLFYIDVIRVLYTGLSGRVVCNNNKHLTLPFNIDQGMKQGCPIAPLLFCLYIDGVVNALQSQQLDGPWVGDLPTPILLYSDDIVLLARTPLSLQKLLDEFVIFMDGRHLNVNISKTKSMSTSDKKSKAMSLHLFYQW